MKVFLVGLPQSGRTTIGKALAQELGYQYIDAVSWVKSVYRAPAEGEHPQQYDDELHHWYLDRLAVNPDLIINNVIESMEAYNIHHQDKLSFIIDGISSPRDLIKLFDPIKDVIVFLNRTNNDAEFKDYENIGVSVMRDYCFWLSSANLISKNRWYEYNFGIPGEETDWVKPLGHKNSVFLIKSINKVIPHLIAQIKAL